MKKIDASRLLLIMMSVIFAQNKVSKGFQIINTSNLALPKFLCQYLSIR